MNRRSFFVFGLLTLSGCGSTGSGGSAPTPSPSPTPEPTPLPVYRVTPLASLGTSALDIMGSNRRGQLIAAERTERQVSAGYWLDTAGARTTLPNLVGYTGNQPSALNDTGLVVGTCYRRGDSVGKGYLYDTSVGTLTALPGFQQALGINGAGKIVGVSDALEPLLYDVATGVTSVLPGATEGFVPQAITDTGLIVGWIGGTVRRGVLYRLGQGSLTTIPLGSGATSNPAYGIAPTGQVLGVQWSSVTDERPYLYDSTTEKLTVVPRGQGNVFVPGELPLLVGSASGLLSSLDNQVGYLFRNGANRPITEALALADQALWLVKYPIRFEADGSLLAQALRRTTATWHLVRLSPG